MSYDINFWKQSRAMDLSPKRVYHKLCEGRPVEGLEALPISDIYSQLKAAFPTFDPTDEFPRIVLDDCGVEVSSSSQHVRFDVRGELGAPIDKLVEIMTAFGCPMYDPQADKRYDKGQGTQVGEAPRFALPEDQVRSRESRRQAAAQIRDEMEREQSAKSIDDLTQEEAAFVELERGFWLGDAAFYLEHLADDAVLAYPKPVGVVGRAKILLVIQLSPSPRWAEVVMTNVRVSRLNCDVTLLVYDVEARHTVNDQPYSALISSVYTRQGGHWRLVFRQETPDMEVLTAEKVDQNRKKRK